MSVHPTAIIALVGAEWQRRALSSRGPLGGPFVRQVRTAGGALDIEIGTAANEWRTAVAGLSAIEGGDAVAAAVCALREQLRTVFALKIRVTILNREASVLGQAFAIDVVVTPPLHVAKHWWPVDSHNREWHRAATSDHVPAELAHRQLLERCVRKWLCGIDLRRELMARWGTPARAQWLAGKYGRRWRLRAARATALAVKYTRRWARRTRFSARPPARIGIGEHRSFYNLILSVLQVTRAEHPDHYRVSQSFLPFRSLARAALPDIDPDPDTWSIIWVFGASGHAYKLVATELAPRLSQRHRGVRYLEIPEVRSTIIVVAEQPGLGFETHTLHYVSCVVPLVRRAFDSKRVKLVVGGGQQDDRANVEGDLLARAFLFCAVPPEPNAAVWAAGSRITISANPRATPAAEIAARAIGCRFEGRVDPIRDDLGGGGGGGSFYGRQ